MALVPSGFRWKSGVSHPGNFCADLESVPVARANFERVWNGAAPHGLLALLVRHRRADPCAIAVPRGAIGQLAAFMARSVRIDVREPDATIVRHKATGLGAFDFPVWEG